MYRVPISSLITRHFSRSINSHYIKMNKPYEHLVFVYGTLKRFQPNHPVLTNLVNGLSHFVCTAKTVERYPLVISSQFNIPFLLGKQGTGNQINGEIYSVDSGMLKFLDDFEGHPDYYTRLETPVITSDNRELKPWIYILERYKPEMLELPMMDTYDSYGPHGLRYVESETTKCLDEIDESR